MESIVNGIIWVVLLLIGFSIVKWLMGLGLLGAAHVHNYIERNREISRQQMEDSIIHELGSRGVHSQGQAASQSQLEQVPNESAFNTIARIANADQDPDVRSEAQSSIKQLFPGGPQGFDELIAKFIEGLRDTNDEDKRQLASFMLISMGEISLPYVKPLTNDQDPIVRREAIRVITAIERDQGTITGYKRF